jgi:hypothetical protein
MDSIPTKLLFGLATRDAGSIKLGVREVFTCEVISQSPFSEAERIIGPIDVVTKLVVTDSIFASAAWKGKARHGGMFLVRFGMRATICTSSSGTSKPTITTSPAPLIAGSLG